jgi:hypothetical protein
MLPDLPSIGTCTVRKAIPSDDELELVALDFLRQCKATGIDDPTDDARFGA